MLACYFGETTRQQRRRLSGMKYMLMLFTGMWGLAHTMRRTLGWVLRLMRAGHQCVVYDRDPATVQALVREGATGAADLADLCARLAPPRNVWIMVPAAVVDRVIEWLEGHTEESQQALPFLFPALERSVRDADFTYNQSPGRPVPVLRPVAVVRAPGIRHRLQQPLATQRRLNLQVHRHSATGRNQNRCRGRPRRMARARSAATLESTARWPWP